MYPPPLMQNQAPLVHFCSFRFPPVSLLQAVFVAISSLHSSIGITTALYWARSYKVPASVQSTATNDSRKETSLVPSLSVHAWEHGPKTTRKVNAWHYIVVQYIIYVHIGFWDSVARSIAHASKLCSWVGNTDVGTRLRQISSPTHFQSINGLHRPEVVGHC